MAASWFEFREMIDFDDPINLTQPEQRYYIDEIRRIAIEEYGEIAGAEVVEDLMDELMCKRDNLHARIKSMTEKRGVRLEGRVRGKRRPRSAPPENISVQEYLASLKKRAA